MNTYTLYWNRITGISIACHGDGRLEEIGWQDRGQAWIWAKKMGYRMMVMSNNPLEPYREVM